MTRSSEKLQRRLCHGFDSPSVAAFSDMRDGRSYRYGLVKQLWRRTMRRIGITLVVAAALAALSGGSASPASLAGSGRVAPKAAAVPAQTLAKSTTGARVAIPRQIVESYVFRVNWQQLSAGPVIRTAADAQTGAPPLVFRPL